MEPSKPSLSGLKRFLAKKSRGFFFSSVLNRDTHLASNLLYKLKISSNTWHHPEAKNTLLCISP